MERNDTIRIRDDDQAIGARRTDEHVLLRMDTYPDGVSEEPNASCCLMLSHEDAAKFGRFLVDDEPVNPICGRWKVKMRGWWWFWFRNVKVIWQNTDGSIQGHNVAWGWLEWGEFDVDTGDEGDYEFDYEHFTDWVDLDGDKAEGSLDINWYIPILWKWSPTFMMTRILPAEDAE